MAKKGERKLTSEDRTDTVIYDSWGREILRLGVIRRELEEGDEGVEFYETMAENIECADGTVVSPGHLMRPTNQGGVTLKRCDICWLESRRAISRRNRNINLFSPAANMSRCFRCGKNLCSKHARHFEEHIVCKHCKTLQFILNRLLKPVFFRRVKRT